MALGTIGLRTKLLYGFGTVAYGIKDNGFNFLLLIFSINCSACPRSWWASPS